MKKLIFAGIVAVVGLGMLAGSVVAEQDRITPPKTLDQMKQLTIALCNMSATDPSGLGERNAVVGLVEEFGGKVIETDAKFDRDKQLSDLRNLIAMRPDGVIIARSAGPYLKPAIDEAAKLGIPVVSLSSDNPGKANISLVHMDNYEAALIVNNYMFDRLNGRGNIVIIGDTPEVSALQERQRQLEAMLPTFPEVKVVAQVRGLQMHEAVEKMESVLTAHPESGSIDAVWTTWFDLGDGAANVIKQYGRTDEIFVVTFDGQYKHTRDYLREGMLSMAVGADPYHEGRIGVRILYTYLYGEDVPRFVRCPNIITDTEKATEQPEHVSEDSGMFWSEWMYDLMNK